MIQIIDRGIRWWEGDTVILRLREKTMRRLVAVAFAFALASSAQAMPIAPVQQPHSIVMTIREACGAGFQRVRGVCVRSNTRAVRRCKAAMRLVGGRCI